MPSRCPKCQIKSSIKYHDSPLSPRHCLECGFEWKPLLFTREAIEETIKQGGLLEADRKNKEKINLS